MPRGAKPKKQSGAAKKREKERKSTVRPAKVREDKTFGMLSIQLESPLYVGLKNKNKSKRVQTNIRNIRNNEKVAGKTADQVRKDREREVLKKKMLNLWTFIS